MAQSWKYPCIDCCSPCGTCCLSCWLPCITYGRIKRRVHEDGDLTNYSCCNLNCCFYFCLAQICCQWIVQMQSRSEVRKKYNLTGNECTDCLCACFCCCCDLVQQDKEAAYWEAQRARQPIETQPKTGAQMIYQPPPAYQMNVSMR